MIVQDETTFFYKYAKFLASGWDMIWYPFTIPHRIRVRYRWYRRYLKCRLKVYPWHLTIFKIGHWTCEFGNDHKYERPYLIWWRSTFDKGGYKSVYWINPNVTHNTTR